IAAAALRIWNNDRRAYLAPTTGPLHESACLPGRLVWPYMTDSTGYTTQFILVNPAGAPAVLGVLHYLAIDGTPLQVDTLKLGSVQIVPFLGLNTPHTHLVLHHAEGGVVTFEP